MQGLATEPASAVMPAAGLDLRSPADARRAAADHFPLACCRPGVRDSVPGTVWKPSEGRPGPTGAGSAVTRDSRFNLLCNGYHASDEISPAPPRPVLFDRARPPPPGRSNLTRNSESSRRAPTGRTRSQARAEWRSSCHKLVLSD